jgi:hypothetical protein
MLDEHRRMGGTGVGLLLETMSRAVRHNGAGGIIVWGVS